MLTAGEGALKKHLKLMDDDDDFKFHSTSDLLLHTGPGDELPDKVKSDADSDDNDDVESNCWMSLGARLQPAHLLFNVSH